MANETHCDGKPDPPGVRIVPTICGPESDSGKTIVTSGGVMLETITISRRTSQPLQSGGLAVSALSRQRPSASRKSNKPGVPKAGSGNMGGANVPEFADTDALLTITPLAVTVRTRCTCCVGPADREAPARTTETR